MKLVMKLLLAVLVVAFLLPFTFLKNEQGSTLMSFSDFSLPEFELPELPSLSSGKDLIPSPAGSISMDTFYKWYDSKGNVQFTSEPPADGVAYTVKQFDPNANVIQAVDLPATNREEPASTPKATAKQQQPGGISSQRQESPYNKQNIGKLFEDSRNVKHLINQRTNSQNDTIN